MATDDTAAADADRPVYAADRAPRHLPLALTSFVGRASELSRLQELTSEHPLVTLVGPGGVGKSRLARELCLIGPAAFADGAWMVELHPLSRGASLADEVRARLGLTGPGSALEDLRAFCADRAMGLVLDNAEHLLPESRDLALALVAAAPGLRVVVTSRTALGVFGERVLVLGPLGLPTAGAEGGSTDPLARARGSEAVQLFVDRAGSGGSGFVLDEQTGADVVELCRRLDGLPLAIELAAARLPVTGLRDLVDRLDDRFELLTNGDPTGPPQHRSLRAVVASSWESCPAAGQDLWSRLAVFSGGANLAAVEAVCAPAGSTGATLIDLVADLVAASVVIAEPSPVGRRYRMLETLAAYGRAQVPASIAQDLRRRHAHHYAALVAAADAAFLGPEQARCTAVVEVEHGNITAALHHLTASTVEAERRLAVVVAVSLLRLWTSGAAADERQRWLDTALEGHLVPDGERAEGLACRALLGALSLRDPGADLEEALGIVDSLGSTGESDDAGRTEEVAGVRVRVHDLQALALAVAGDRAGAEAARLQSRRWSAVLRTPPRNPAAELADHYARVRAGAPGAAEDAIAAERDRAAAGDRFHGSLACFVVAFAGRREQRPEWTRDYGLRSVELGLVSGNVLCGAMSLVLLAEAASTERGHQRAATLLGAAMRLAADAGSTVGFLEVLEEAADVVRSAGVAELGRAEFATAADRGRAWPTPDILAWARGGDDDVPGPVDPDPAVTPRELEVARMVAHGHTNREIAERLMLSIRTVEGHVERVLRKLGFQRRIQIATWIVRQEE